MPRVGSDRGQIGLDQMGSDSTNSDWIDSARLDPDRGRLGPVGIGSDQLGSHRPRFHLGSRYLRAHDIRYPHPSHHGHRTPEKAGGEKMVNRIRWPHDEVFVSRGVCGHARLPTATGFSNEGQIRVGHEGGGKQSGVRYPWCLRLGLGCIEVRRGKSWAIAAVSRPPTTAYARAGMSLACFRHKVALRATISHWLSSLASAWHFTWAATSSCPNTATRAESIIY